MLRRLILLATMMVAASAVARADGDEINGTWKNENVAWVVNVDARGDLTMREADPTDTMSHLGDLVGQAKKIGPNEWSGQHIWGGKKHGSTKWGDPGGLYVKLISGTKLFVQYRDSIYSDGWTLSK
jgi:hypothetical protein